MTNIAKWKDPPFFSSVNHLFLWTIYTMAMLVITRGYILIYISWLYSLHHFQVPKKQGRVGSMFFSTSISYGSKSGWWFQPLLKNMSSSVGVTIIPNIWKKWKNKKCSKPPTK